MNDRRGEPYVPKVANRGWKPYVSPLAAPDAPDPAKIAARERVVRLDRKPLVHAAVQERPRLVKARQPKATKAANPAAQRECARCQGILGMAGSAAIKRKAITEGLSVSAAAERLHVDLLVSRAVALHNGSPR